MFAGLTKMFFLTIVSPTTDFSQETILRIPLNLGWLQESDPSILTVINNELHRDTSFTLQRFFEFFFILKST